MGISQVPPVPTPVAKGDIVVGTAAGPTRLPANTTANFSLLTDPTTATGLKYGQTGKVWSVVNHGVAITSVSGNATGRSVGAPSTPVYYLGNTFVFGTQRGAIGYSTDGKNWTYQFVFPSNNPINAIAFNGTTWVAGGGANLLYSGTLGGTWTARTSQIPSTQPIHDIVWVAGSINLFILCAESNGAGANVISSSADGFTWTARYAVGSSGMYMIAVNAANSVIMIMNTAAASGSQGVFSTNGTTWSTVPMLATSSSGGGQIYYLPHADRFCNFRTGTRRAPANVGTAWDTVTYEEQKPWSQNLSDNTNNSDLGFKKFRPIWDAANSRYYFLDIAYQGPGASAMLFTADNTDLLVFYSTGARNSYSLKIIGAELLPSSPYYTLNSTSFNGSMVPSIGYGNGIWVYVSTGASGFNEGFPIIYSTAP